MDSPFRTFAVDVRAEREAIAVRSIAVLAVLGAIAWACWHSPSTPQLGLLGLATLGVAAWMSRIAKRARLLRQRTTHTLSLTETDLVLQEGPNATRVPWRDVENVECDEEMLVVRVRRRGADDLLIDPRYEGGGMYDLTRAVEAAFQAGRRQVGP